MNKSRIVCVGAPPGTGKTTILPVLHDMLGPSWVYLDNEWAFSMEMRKLCSEKSGIPLNSPDFVKAFNFRGQMDYQNLARKIASQGVNVLMPGPFEDLTPDIGGLPLYRKMKEVDFAEFDFSVVYLLLHPEERLHSSEVLGHPEMVEVERTIQNRLRERGADNETQRVLDSDKHGEDYYSLRTKKVLFTVETFPEIKLVTFEPDESPMSIALRVSEILSPDVPV